MAVRGPSLSVQIMNFLWLPSKVSDRDIDHVPPRILGTLGDVAPQYGVRWCLVGEGAIAVRQVDESIRLDVDFRDLVEHGTEVRAATAGATLLADIVQIGRVVQFIDTMHFCIAPHDDQPARTKVLKYPTDFREEAVEDVGADRARGIHADDDITTAVARACRCDDVADDEATVRLAPVVATAAHATGEEAIDLVGPRDFRLEFGTEDAFQRAGKLTLCAGHSERASDGGRPFHIRAARGSLLRLLTRCGAGSHVLIEAILSRLLGRAFAAALPATLAAAVLSLIDAAVHGQHVVFIRANGLVPQPVGVVRPDLAFDQRVIDDVVHRPVERVGIEWQGLTVRVTYLAGKGVAM